ncbi:NYN domain-containing protein [Leptolyngbya cf. ectocarpi LEGE 11479]|uniref:NYN domain-containing protein n=1 Tax=Leptolyngbya cf. ectocarpi LEGE 11479 TaxID=1828722 RepID=A0A928ZZ03_LEPEC|nr:NYN domain-containing protein [Leptolyngbya ectocarpi]MBE9070018.1 NYN domain-containing protein [Leptolyngbya cf. ectocarpi LEGE 11479]
MANNIEHNRIAQSPNSASSRLSSNDFKLSPDGLFAPSYASRQLPDKPARMAVLVDGANLFYSASYLGIEIDYVRLLQTLVGQRQLLRSYFYTGVDPKNEKQRGFLLWLSRHGYRVISKDLAQVADGSRRANLHVEMAVDMLRLADHCDTITLLSGDGHLTYAVDALSSRGVRVELVSLQSMTSDTLIDLADCYINLAELQDTICKRR